MTAATTARGYDQTVALSVIVPVWRQWDRTGLLLGALRTSGAVDGKDGVEVILADNSGPDEPGGPPALPGARIVRCPQPGSYAARNAGAAAAAGDWLIFTDADCLPQPGWIAAWRRTIAAGTGKVLAGPVEMQAGKTPGFVESYDLLRGIPQERYVARGYAATANLAVEAALFRALGGFDATRFSGGDADFTRRAAAAGHPVCFASAARVIHPCRTGWTDLIAKSRRIRGGQVLHGPILRRAAWVARGFVPPVDHALRFAQASAPIAVRARAIAVLAVLWADTILETARLALGRQPERR